jgi:hypothetical protein
MLQQALARGGADIAANASMLNSIRLVDVRQARRSSIGGHSH